MLRKLMLMYFSFLLHAPTIFGQTISDQVKGYFPGPNQSPLWSVMLPPAGQNNLWFAQNAKSDTVIIFIHGIISDSRGAWTYEDAKDKSKNMYWPYLVWTDPNLRNPSVYLGGFYTAVNSGNYDMKKAGLDLKEALVRDRVLEKKTKVILIGHSTGGIIARYVLVHYPQLFAQKQIGLLLMASPSLGSKLSTALAIPEKFMNQQMAAQLQWESEFLKQLDNDFRLTVFENKTFPLLFGKEVLENKFVIGKYLPNSLLVVEETSGSKYFGPGIVVGGTDHITLVKPTALNHPTHQILVGFYNEYFADNRYLERLSEKSLDEKIIENTQAIEQNPNDVAAYYERGRAYRQRKLPESAINDFSKALELYANDVKSLMERAAIYGERQQWRLAVDDLIRAQKVSPNMVAIYAQLGKASQYAAAQQVDPAWIKYYYEYSVYNFSTALQLQPNSGDFYRSRAISLRALQRNDEAAMDEANAAKLP